MKPEDIKKMESIRHPLHPQHTLTFLRESDMPWFFVCNGCREIQKRRSNVVGCQRCKFYLDLNCAALMDDFFSKYDRHRYEEMEKHDNKRHFSHKKHALKLGRLKDDPSRYGYCCYCRKKPFGYVYCCPDCEFYIHESCMDEMKEEVKHPFHPQHLLRVYEFDEYEQCQACRNYTKGVYLSCRECQFGTFHYSCAREPFPRPLKLKYHEHPLYYFERDALVEDFRCELCQVKERNSIYRCLECFKGKKGSFHLECISLRGKVKHKSHNCELTLCDSVKGYDSDEFRCDICEEPGSCRHHVYRCQKCNYIAHIECVISEEEDSEEIPSSSVANLEIDADQEGKTK